MTDDDLPDPSNRGWYGVDLDGTLAHHEEGGDTATIGQPILPMLTRVRRWLAAGRAVRIVTARASRSNPRQAEQVAQIEAWCTDHLGQKLPVTSEKDFTMIELWDDRAVQVVRNTGRRADGIRDL